MDTSKHTVTIPVRDYQELTKRPSWEEANLVRELFSDIIADVINKVPEPDEIMLIIKQKCRDGINEIDSWY